MNDMKILLPLDDSPQAQRTVKTLLEMKDKFRNCTLTLLHVFVLEKINYRGIPASQFDMIEEKARASAKKFIEEQRDFFLNEGMRAEAMVVDGYPRKTICALADSGDYDLLVIGRHTEGELRNLLFGYVSNYVIHRVKSPVLIL
jgi:nucleotide-binding universal stress UspA family protein